MKIYSSTTIYSVFYLLLLLLLLVRMNQTNSNRADIFPKSSYGQKISKPLYITRPWITIPPSQPNCLSPLQNWKKTVNITRCNYSPKMQVCIHIFSIFHFSPHFLFFLIFSKNLTLGHNYKNIFCLHNVFFTVFFVIIPESSCEFAPWRHRY